MTYVSNEVRREQFIDAAVRVVRQHGISKATTRRIAEEAGAPLASMHYCFRNKEELFEAVSQELGAAFKQTATSKVREGMGLEAAVETLLASYVDWVDDPDSDQLTEYEFHIWSIRSDKVAISKTLYDDWLSFLHDALTLGAGTDASTKDMTALARTLLALVDGYMIQDMIMGENNFRANAPLVGQVLSRAIRDGDFDLPAA